ncbi:S-DNA-T family DNA segregation ATPase FtsK/SpoIIIE, partial [Microvirga flocculans]
MTERLAEEIASVRAVDPAPAVQERLEALQSRASQQAETEASRPFNRISPQPRTPVRRPAAPASREEAVRKPTTRTSAPVARDPVAAPRAAMEPAAPVRDSAADYRLSSVQQSYSFLWQPGTYLLDPSLRTPLVPAPSSPLKREERVPVVEALLVKRSKPEAEAIARSPARPPLPAEPEDLPWEDEDDLHDFLDEEDDVVEEAPRRAAMAPQPRVSHAPMMPAPANDVIRRDNYASVSVGVSAPVGASFEFEPPSLDLLAEPKIWDSAEVPVEVLQENAATLENVLWDFNVKGEIINVRPGPVVTLYELEPAPGTKSSRVISLADDIARS